MYRLDLFVGEPCGRSHHSPLEPVFFFSSRRRHTRWNCDWSSDVCSSDLRARKAIEEGRNMTDPLRETGIFPPDRKSTRLNSSHSSISYAVFCLKKKNN